MSFKRASQLSLHLFAVWTRLELATPCVTGMYSNQLNYQTVLCCKERFLFLRCKGKTVWRIVQIFDEFFSIFFAIF